MRKLIILTQILALLISAPAFCMVVTDTGAYAYWIEQLKSAEQQIKQAQNTVKGVQDVQKEVKSVQDQMTGTYNKASSLIDNLKKVQKTITNAPSSVSNVGDKWKGIIKDLDGFVDVKDILDSVYNDPRTDKKKAWEKIDEHYQIRQEALKNAIGQCDDAAQALKERMKVLDELANQIDSTQNLKESQDLTNRFLAEILYTTELHYALFAQISQANALLYYSGVDDESMTARKSAADKAISQQSTSEYQIDGNVDSSKIKSNEDMKNFLLKKK